MPDLSDKLPTSLAASVQAALDTGGPGHASEPLEVKAHQCFRDLFFGGPAGWLARINELDPYRLRLIVWWRMLVTLGEEANLEDRGDDPRLATILARRAFDVHMALGEMPLVHAEVLMGEQPASGRRSDESFSRPDEGEGLPDA